jgi:hypothetical protein
MLSTSYHFHTSQKHNMKSFTHHQTCKTNIFSQSHKHSHKIMSHSHFYKSYFEVHQNTSQYHWKHWKDTQNTCYYKISLAWIKANISFRCDNPFFFYTTYKRSDRSGHVAKPTYGTFPIICTWYTESTTMQHNTYKHDLNSGRHVYQHNY